MKTLTVKDHLVLERLFREAVDIQIQLWRICSNIEAIVGDELELEDVIMQVAAGCNDGKEVSSETIEELIQEWQDPEDPDD